MKTKILVVTLAILLGFACGYGYATSRALCQACDGWSTSQAQTLKSIQNYERLVRSLPTQSTDGKVRVD